MRRLLVLAALLTAALGAAAPAVAAESTATGTGGAASSVDALATRRRADSPAQRRQRRRRRGRSRRRPRRRRAVLLRHRRRRLHGHLARRPARSRPSTAGRPRPPPCADVVLRPNGQPLAFDDAPLSGLSVGVPGTRARAGTSRCALRDVLARARAAARHPRREGRLHGRPRRSPGRSSDNQAAFAQVPSTAALYLDPTARRATSARRSRNPDLARTYEAIAKRRRRRVLHRPDRAGDRPTRSTSRPSRPRPITRGVPARRHDDRRPRRVRGARARPDARRSYRGLDVYGMGPPSSGGTTVGEVAEHPRAHRPRRR